MMVKSSANSDPASVPPAAVPFQLLFSEYYKMQLKHLISVPLLLLCSIQFGCGRDADADRPELTPELQQQIRQEDAAVDAAEGGKGAIRNP
jgi:hypothetical protein